MKRQLSIGAFLLLTASLFFGFAARAQGVVQDESVAYTLTLVNADAPYQCVDATTSNLRVQVTLSLPREAGVTYFGPSVQSNNPARVMFRRHKGPATAFDGTLVLTRNAPYASDGATPQANGYYPMPQADADGISITNPADLNRKAVMAGSTTNISNEAYSEYVGVGLAHDKARWEATYLSQSFSVAEILAANEGSAQNLQFLQSLLLGQSTYEWFIASRRGIGSAARISDIQDHGRAPTFDDVRLWEGDSTDTSVTLTDDAARTLGKYARGVLRTMPLGSVDPASGKYSWTFFHACIGSNWRGAAGAQLLSYGPTTAADPKVPRIESPVFPDGVSSITFTALATESSPEAPPTLLVQTSKDGGSTWTDYQELTLTAAKQEFTVEFADDVLPSGAESRFRLVRTTYASAGGAANTLTYVINNLIVRSARPQTEFSELAVTLDGDATSAEPYATNAFNASVSAIASSDNPPRGYTGELRLRRRAEGDVSRAWYKAPLNVAYDPTTGHGTLTASFEPGTLITNAADGVVNVRENAFFTDVDGAVTGMLAGVYDVAIDCGVYGSFKAGRTNIDEHEVASTTLDGYDRNEYDENNLPVTVRYPYTLNVRERAADAESVELHVMYRTGNDEKNYDLDILKVPLLPSAKLKNVWRVDLAKLLKLEESTAVYAWGYEPTNPDEAAIFEEGYIAFKICVTDKAGNQTWIGQDSAVAASTRPPTVDVVPSVSETLKVAASEDKAVPVMIAVDELTTSHLQVELNLTDATAPTADLGGSFWQDFNTWDPSNAFVETEFRENITAVTADFDCTTFVDTDNKVGVDAGWKPDEGPLAETSAFTDEFPVGRSNQVGQFPFILRDASYVENTRLFASWGAASEYAEPSYLRASESEGSIYTDYLKIGTGSEVVLRRSVTEEGGVWRPDALFRLRGDGSLEPRNDTAASITLNGVGKVSFRLGMSLPYDITSIAQIVSNGDNLMGYKGRGLSAGVTVNNPSQNCAPSGYSVSYYLMDYSIPMTPVFYELRVTQTMRFPAEVSERPTDRVVMELYRWNNGTPTRQTLQTIANNPVEEHFHDAGSSLLNTTYGLWVDPSGHLVLGRQGGYNMDTLVAVAKSKEALISNPATASFNLALGSAECRPVFRYVNRMTASTEAFTAAPISPDAVTVMVADGVEQGSRKWSLAADSASSGRTQISRLTPPAQSYGRVRVTARSGNSTVSRDFSTTGMDQLCEMTLGMANAEVTIEPYREEGQAKCTNNIFIDDLSISSWCGNDENRNGRDNVPLFTNEGFSANTGFAAVGVWIRPEDDSQLTSLPSNYNGKQCLLMQRSRQNNETTTETVTDGITHTGNALALYLPFSGNGLGPVSFRYRIPEQDEYGKQGTLPSVYVMLQYIKDGPYVSFLGTTAPKNSEWVNASAPIELPNTGGEWAMTSITPKLNGKELVGVEGTLRMVMVITDEMDASDDPYVYLDDVRVTDNKEGTSASWTATNVRVSSADISKLYWKDRLPTDGVTPPETTFAQKSSLTRALQFNQVMTDEATEGTYATTVLESPILEEGVGRLTFAARLTDPKSKPVRLYICATTDASDAMTGLQPVTYVEVPNTVYTAFDIDLSKYKYYYTVPNADGTPSATATGDVFDCSQIRRLTIKAFLEGDGVQTDGFGAAPTYGRVFVDQLAIANPVLPSIRVASVAFSNLPGSNNPAEFDARSPLSQPVQNASVLRTMVRLDRAQLLKPDSIRVFLTIDPHNVESAASSVRTMTNSYTYNDVLGGVVSATSTHPVYTWRQDDLDAWPRDAWFDLEASFEKLRSNSKLGDPTVLTASDLEAIQIDNTIELTKDASGILCYYGDLSIFDSLKGLPENSLVRYNAWVVYQSEEGDQWFYTQITPAAYTEFPWYFPRSLNAELREKASTDTDKKTEAFFSPYFWIYSYLPGEAFINEFNLNDNSQALSPSIRHFVEICAPVNTNLGGWRVEATNENTAASISETSFSIAPDAAGATTNKTFLEPEVGAVPYQRKTATSAERAFYTAFSADSDVYYRENGEEKTDLPKTANAGVAERNLEFYSLGSGHQASSVRLHRPTGGAEHIVCFSLNGEGNVGSVQSQRNLTNLYEDYRSAYAEHGFGGEWSQTFTTGSWEDYSDDAMPDSFGKSTVFTAEMHARRLVKADTFKADATKDNRFALNGKDTVYVNDLANSAYANSIATVDMGGIFVTRKNAINVDVDNGPLDLTHLVMEKWPTAINPVEQTRPNEPTGGTENLTPVVQVTPRQINPDQYLVLYSGFASSAVTSELSGAFGSHSLESFDENGVSLRVNPAGRNTPQTWGLAKNVAKSTLTYTAFPFHTVSSLTFRVKDASDATKIITDAAMLATIASLDVGTADFATAATNEGWVTVTLPADAAAVALTTITTSPTNEEEHYSVEAKAAFALDPSGGVARDVITQVRPYCGDGSADFPMPGSAKYQPWWGANFGFEVGYDVTPLNNTAVLSSVIVTYPSPAALRNQAWEGLLSDWTGYEFEYQVADPEQPGVLIDKVARLEGMEYTEAIETLNELFVPNAGTRYVELHSGRENVFADASAVSAPGEAYARVMGYPTTAAMKEPAVPFCVWGVYTVTLQVPNGNEKVSFLMRQAMPGEKPSVWTYPAHYAPMPDRNAGIAPENTIPYFHLYSTPSQAAWLNEVNLVQRPAEDETPFVEVAFPHLRDGILSTANPTVPQAEPSGWKVVRYAADGEASDVGAVSSGTISNSGSTSYKYYTLGITEDPASQAAYVLHRPCGAAEGGVWTGVTADGNDEVLPPASVAQNSWLIPPETSFVVAGKSDAQNVPGSVQLVGKTVLRDGYARLSSAVADRTEWTFDEASKGADNGGIRPDTKPVWNQVTFTSTLRNTVYAGSTCGYQLVPGAFDQENLVGDTQPITLTLGGGEWVYNDAVDGLVLSYRPRANYRFETLTLPADLIGKVMLVGRRGSLTPETILERVTALKNLAVTKGDIAKTTDWLSLEGRASVEYRTVVDGTVSYDEPTGKIIFNTDFVESEDEEGEVTTFGDMDNYVISLVFVEEPSSAQNTIEVAFGQGEVKLGAWMITQSFYALTDDGNGTLVPDFSKGGDTTVKPIWSDENGNVNGEHANVHGWLYQPLAGDTVGMSVVINPDLGLEGGQINDPVAEFERESPSLRPFLVWTAIPKSRVPTNLFDSTLMNTAGVTRNDFIKSWGLSEWIGTPSVQDRVTIQLRTLRQRLRAGASSTATTALYSAAGIIPMTYLGYCDKNGVVSKVADNANRASDNLLAFRTITEEELTEALANEAVTGLSTEGTLDTDVNPLLPYSTAIDMSDPELWRDGAILRFAVVIADALTGYVYDCQSISNFSSDALRIYCPWYVPEEQTNVNLVTSSTEAGGGVSPFAWVYDIPQGGVWINEFRPFAVTASDNRRVASAVELAMYASPLVEDVSDVNAPPQTFTPTRTLEGWKVVTRYAPLPALNSDPADAIQWTTHKEVPLHSWIPYRRITKSLADSTQDAAKYTNAIYDLDYYTAIAVMDPEDTSVNFGATVSNQDPFYRAASYTAVDGTANAAFQWLNFNLEGVESDSDLFNADLQTTLSEESEFADGIIYSIALVRNNGVVEDAVLFYNASPYAGFSNGDELLMKRLDIALKSESLNNTTAGTVRAVTDTALPSSTADYAQYPAQFLKFTNKLGVSSLLWRVAFSAGVKSETFSSPNSMEGGSSGSVSYTQPYLEYASPAANFANVEAVINGGEGATLKLENNGNTFTGRTVTTSALMGSAYTLGLENWDTDWYALSQVTRNGADFTPVEGYAVATTYALNSSAQTYATKKSIVIANDIVTQSVVYNLVFTYTADANLLAAAGALDSDDAGFTEWLQQSTPAAIAAQSVQDDVPAVEKYWLGLDSPSDDAAAYRLRFTAIGSYVDLNSTEENPTVCVELSDGTTRITDLTGDGNVVLLGKQKLEDADWVYLMTLESDDLKEDAEIIIMNTDCQFFRAVLMSDAEIQSLVSP